MNPSFQVIVVVVLAAALAVIAFTAASFVLI